MIIVGYMVGVDLRPAHGDRRRDGGSASEQGGLGQQLVYFSSLIRMDEVRRGDPDHRSAWSLDLRRVLLHRQALGELGELAGRAQQEGREEQGWRRHRHRGAQRRWLQSSRAPEARSGRRGRRRGSRRSGSSRQAARSAPRRATRRHGPLDLAARHARGDGRLQPRGSRSRWATSRSSASTRS